MVGTWRVLSSSICPRESTKHRYCKACDAGTDAFEFDGVWSVSGLLHHQGNEAVGNNSWAKTALITTYRLQQHPLQDLTHSCLTARNPPNATANCFSGCVPIWHPYKIGTWHKTSIVELLLLRTSHVFILRTSQNAVRLKECPCFSTDSFSPNHLSRLQKKLQLWKNAINPPPPTIHFFFRPDQHTK